MTEIISRLENNLFSGILLKKGKNIITESVYKTLKSDKHFARFLAKGFIKTVSEKKEDKQDKQAVNVDLTDYNELKRYVVENGIKTASIKKEDLLKAVKGEV